MPPLLRECWYIAAATLLALWAVVAGSGVVAFAVTAIRNPERVREALRSFSRRFTD